jgi:hypothetical protein
MKIFENIIYSIPKTYTTPPTPSIHFFSNIFPDIEKCSNCKKYISSETSKIECEVGHRCCSNCFETRVKISILLKTNIVSCCVNECEKNYSEKTIKDNIITSLYEKLSSYYSSSLTKIIHKKYTYGDGDSTKGDLLIDLSFFHFLYFYFIYFIYYNKLQQIL